jgi:hypothetical protein
MITSQLSSRPSSGVSLLNAKSSFRTLEWYYSEHTKYIQLLPKSNQLQLITSWILDELEKHRFRHLTQHGQDFSRYNIKFQQLLVSLLWVPKVAHFHGAFFQQKNSAVATAEVIQLFIENLLRTRWQQANK